MRLCLVGVYQIIKRVEWIISFFFLLLGKRERERQGPLCFQSEKIVDEMRAMGQYSVFPLGWLQYSNEKAVRLFSGFPFLDSDAACIIYTVYI